MTFRTYEKVVPVITFDCHENTGDCVFVKVRTEQPLTQRAAFTLKLQTIFFHRFLGDSPTRRLAQLSLRRVVRRCDLYCDRPPVLTDRSTCPSRSCPAAIFCYFKLLLLQVHNKITNHIPPVAITEIITPVNPWRGFLTPLFVYTSTFFAEHGTAKKRSATQHKRH